MGKWLVKGSPPETSPISIPKSLLQFEMAVLSSVRDPFCVIDRNHRILGMIKAMAAIYGKPYEDFAGKRCYRYLKNGIRPCQDCPISVVFKTGRSSISERYRDFSDGHRRWGKVRAYPIRDRQGQVLAACVIVIDIADLKRKIESQQKYSHYLSRKLHSRAPKSQTVNLDDGDIAINTCLSQREKDVLRLI